MEVSEVINKKNILKQEILSLIGKFESETSCRVSSVDYGILEVQGYSENRKSAIGRIVINIDFEASLTHNGNN